MVEITNFGVFKTKVNRVKGGGKKPIISVYKHWKQRPLWRKILEVWQKNPQTKNEKVIVNQRDLISVKKVQVKQEPIQVFIVTINQPFQRLIVNGDEPIFI